MASQSVTSTSNNNVREKRALVFRLFKKFPHLFQKTPKPNDPKAFSLRLSASATPQKIQEAIHELEQSGDHADKARFKNLLTLCSQNHRETPLIPNVAPEAPSRTSDDRDYNAWLVKSFLAIRNPDVKPQDAEETVTEPPISGDDLESVRFDFGDDYGNRREFEELRKEVELANLLRLRGTGIAPRVAEYNDKDIYELSSLEDMLKEFEKDNLL